MDIGFFALVGIGVLTITVIFFGVFKLSEE